MTILQFPAHRIGPRRAVLSPSVVEFRSNSNPDSDMAYAMLTLGLIFSAAILSAMLGTYFSRAIPGDEG